MGRSPKDFEIFKDERLTDEENRELFDYLHHHWKIHTNWVVYTREHPNWKEEEKISQAEALEKVKKELGIFEWTEREKYSCVWNLFDCNGDPDYDKEAPLTRLVDEKMETNKTSQRLDEISDKLRKGEQIGIMDRDVKGIAVDYAVDRSYIVFALGCLMVMDVGINNREVLNVLKSLRKEVKNIYPYFPKKKRAA